MYYHAFHKAAKTLKKYLIINITNSPTIYFRTLLKSYLTLRRSFEEDRSFNISHCYDTGAWINTILYISPNRILESINQYSVISVIWGTYPCSKRPLNRCWNWISYVLYFIGYLVMEHLVSLQYACCCLVYVMVREDLDMRMEQRKWRRGRSVCRWYCNPCLLPTSLQSASAHVCAGSGTWMGEKPQGVTTGIQ